MSDHIKSEDLRKAAASCDDCKSREKIKTPFARIIVGGTIENPYFEILYSIIKISVFALDSVPIALHMFISGCRKNLKLQKELPR